jgi:type IV pilus assembly protein PilV
MEPIMKRLNCDPRVQRACCRPGVQRSQRGVALVEALISILIFSFGVLGLIGLEASAINVSVDVEDRNRAALFASEIASTLWLSGSVSVSNAQLAAWNSAFGDPTHTGAPGGTVTVTPVAGTTNSTDIKLTWAPVSDPAGSAARQLTTRITLP